MCQLNREWHQFRGLVTREPEHKPLVACAARVNAHGNIRGLFIDRGQDGAGVTIEAVFGPRITYFSNGFTCHLREVDLRVGCDLAGDHDQTRRNERLAGDASGAILRKDRVEDGVRNLVGYFIWMAFGYGFRSEEITAGVAQLLNASCGLSVGKEKLRTKER